MPLSSMQGLSLNFSLPISVVIFLSLHMLVFSLFNLISLSLSMLDCTFIILSSLFHVRGKRLPHLQLSTVDLTVVLCSVLTVHFPEWGVGTLTESNQSGPAFSNRS